jgi:uncharacterized protein
VNRVAVVPHWAIVDSDNQTPNQLRGQISKSIERIEELLSYLPDEATRNLRTRIATLRGVLLEQRPPAIALVGRRGAGKSSLVNALFGSNIAPVGHVKARTMEGRWYEHRSARGALSILDTRGLQEGASATESDPTAAALGGILRELRRQPPDILLFLVRASDVDSAIDADLDGLVDIVSEVERERGKKPPVFCVVTACDLLEPLDVVLDEAREHDDPEVAEKLALLALAERTIDRKIRARAELASAMTGTLGISSYLSFRPDGSIRSDARFRVPRLAEKIFSLLPQEGRGHFARIARIRKLQDELAMSLTRATAALCAGVAAIPIPVADVIPLTALQVSLVAGIAWVGGRSLDSRGVAEFLAAVGVNTGAAFALREATRALVKFAFPGAGAVVSATVAFTGTMAIGAAASAYFLHGGTAEDAKREFLRVQNGKEAQAEAAAASSSSTLPDAPTGPEADQTAAPAAPDAS